MRNIDMVDFETSTEEQQRVRHPEKQHRPDNPIKKKPDWIRVKAPMSAEYNDLRKMMRNMSLTTVCEEAACPNMGECWTQKHASFMILGEVCTRACSFCNVSTGKPDDVDRYEPLRIAQAVKKMGLRHVVITSVDRDDLDDGGAAHFVKTINAIHDLSVGTSVEILTPDFKGKDGAIEQVVAAKPEVFNHNMETVPRLYPTIRPGARYFTSLELLHRVKKLNPNGFTKSGMMMGLGETKEEVMQVMDDLRAADVDFITLGQYLQPTVKHAEVKDFVTPDQFENYAQIARAKGFLMVTSSPLTRSSHHADKDFEKLQAARREKNISEATG